MQTTLIKFRLLLVSCAVDCLNVQLRVMISYVNYLRLVFFLGRLVFLVDYQMR